MAQNARIVAYVAEYQNLNSGRRRTNGRNSSSSIVGSAGADSGASAEAAAAATSDALSFGCRNSMSEFNW